MAFTSEEMTSSKFWSRLHSPRSDALPSHPVFPDSNSAGQERATDREVAKISYTLHAAVTTFSEDCCHRRIFGDLLRSAHARIRPRIRHHACCITFACKALSLFLLSTCLLISVVAFSLFVVSEAHVIGP